MQNRPYIAAAAVAILAIGIMLLNTLRNPMAARRSDLAQRLEQAMPQSRDLDDTGPDFEAIQGAIKNKPALWRELIPPPPPPPPKRVPPDFDKLLKGVSPTHQQVGDKIRVNIGDSYRWMEVGDKYNSLTLHQLKSDKAIFAIKKDGKLYTKELPRK